MQRTLKLVLLSALVLAGTAVILPQPAQAQKGERSYAPEDLWTLSTSEQTRVISLEYREQSSGRSIPGDQLRFYLDQVRLSRWTFSKVKNDIAKSLGHNGGGWQPPGGGGNQDSIRCESNDGRARSCNTPWRGNSYLRRQLSDARCIGGQTWFSSNGRITVTRGCRGEFGPSHGQQDGNLTLRCESTDGRFRSCGDNVVGRAQLLRQLSSTRCIENSNFGVSNRRLWVDRGCRGEFMVRTSSGDWNPPPGGDYSVTCSSNQGRYATCAWDARQGTPQLLQQLSNDVCRNGYSWGYSVRTGLWVNHGCRARFGTR